MLRHFIISVIAIVIGAYLIPGVLVTVQGAIVFALVLALINIFIRPVIFLLTLPINILTLGLFSLVINAVLIFYAARFVSGVTISGFWPAFWFSIVLGIITAIFGRGQKSA